MESGAIAALGQEGDRVAGLGEAASRCAWVCPVRWTSEGMGLRLSEGRMRLEL